MSLFLYAAAALCVN